VVRHKQLWAGPFYSKQNWTQPSTKNSIVQVGGNEGQQVTCLVQGDMYEEEREQREAGPPSALSPLISHHCMWFCASSTTRNECLVVSSMYVFQNKRNILPEDGSCESACA